MLVLLFSAPVSWAKLGVEYQMALGNPTEASPDALNRTDYLLSRSQYAISYNDDTRQANWVSWSYTTTDSGATDRTDAWSIETDLPAGYLRIGTATFGTGWDRGHMTPSADRTLTYADNAITFRMSNMIPQASRNNQGLWGNFEAYCRTMAADGSEILIISGPSEFSGATIANGMAISASVWKIAVKVPAGNGTAASRMTTGCRVIALLTPNLNIDLGGWQNYITSVEDIEAMTGFDFFSDIDPSVATYLKNLVDTGTGPDTPTVVTSFTPTTGGIGSTVVLSGYNFGATPVVQFQGVTAVATVNEAGTQITATVPEDASSGEISVTGPGGTDTSYESFTVANTTAPAITLSTVNLGGFLATQGDASPDQSYILAGTNLTGNVTVTAPAGFEIGLNSSSSFSSSLVLAPTGGVLSNVPIHVRTQASATVGSLSGSITHAGGSAATRNLTLSGTIRSSQPTLTLSTGSLSGFQAVQGSQSGVKTYTLSGYNLTGNLTVTAPAHFELSFNGASFAASQSLAPNSGEILNTPVSVRLANTAPAGSISGAISHQGGGLTTGNIAVSGTVFEAGSGGSSEITWDFTQATATSGVPESLTVSAVEQKNNNGTTLMLSTSSVSSGYAGASGGNNAAASPKPGAFTTNSTCLEFTTTPAADTILSLTGISFGTRSTSTGPIAYSLRSSADGYATPLASGSITANSTWTLISHTSLSLSTQAPVTFRLYAHSGTGSTSTANWRVDDLKVTVSTASTINPYPVPEITSASVAMGTAFEAFSYQLTASEAPTSHAVSGLPNGLSFHPGTQLITGTPTTPGTYNVTLTASNANGDGTADLALTILSNPNAPLLAEELTTSGQLRAEFHYQIVAGNQPTGYLASNLPDGLSLNTTTGEIKGTPTETGVFNVPITVQNALGSDSDTLQITILDPSLTLTPVTLDDFTAIFGTASSTRNYAVSGSSLTSPVTITAPQNFEISTDGLAFVGNVTLSPAGGVVGANITVRLSAGAALGLSAGAIIHSGSGAIPKYMNLSGIVSAPDPILNLSISSMEGFSANLGEASFAQSCTITARNLSGNVTLTAPSGYEVSLNGVSYSGGLTLTPVEGSLDAVLVSVRLADTASAGSVSGSVTHSTTGATVKLLAVSGEVLAPLAPVITSVASGSAYVRGTFSHTITVEGSPVINGYFATGLPSGLSLNSGTGVISGKPTGRGTSVIGISVATSGGTSTANYTLSVFSAEDQAAIPLSVAVNKFHNNGTADVLELLVTGNGVPGQQVDLRGMVVKDFSSNSGNDSGGKYVFTNAPLWAAVKAGTLVVLSAGTTAPEDLNGDDFVLRVNLGNTTCFTHGGGVFDISINETILIKAPGSGVGGVAGGIHSLTVGTAGAQYNNFTGRKTRSTSSLSQGRPYGFVVNTNSALTDYQLSNGAGVASSLTYGSANNAANGTFISFLRYPDVTAPVITLNGTNPMTVAFRGSYSEPGATAFDETDGAVEVFVTGSVNTSVAGNQTLTYTATDAAQNAATATRTVQVLGQSPVISTLPAASLQGSAAMLGGNVTDEGSAAASGRGVVYSSTDTTPTVGEEGVTSLASGSGPGAFTASATGLSSETAYFFRAYATNSVGTSYGAVETFTTLKAEPGGHVTGFAASGISKTNIPVVWIAPGSPPDGYLLMVGTGAISDPVDGIPVANDLDVSNGSASVNLSPGVESYSGFTGFAGGTNYTFAIYPFHNSGGAIDYKTDSEPSITVLSVPAAPAPAPTFASVNSSGFTVNWTATTGAIGYRLDVATGGDFTSFVSGYEDLAIPSGTSQQVTALGANTTYHARVRAVNSSGTSDSSSTGTQTTAQLAAPSTSPATNITSSGFQANWNAVEGATGYRLDVYSSAGTTTADLLISEYVEGSSSNKYIEIYNGTGAAANLSDYELRLFSNGGSTASANVTLSALAEGPSTLASGATLLLKNASSVLELPAGVTAYSTAVIGFNGDDAVAIWKKSTSSYVDIFGVIGTDPGTAWTNANPSRTTLDRTLRRKSTVSQGVTANPSTFSTLASEWDEYGVDTATGLGAHGEAATFLEGYENADAGAATSLLVTGASPGTGYRYAVRATSANSMSANSDLRTATTSGAPTLTLGGTLAAVDTIYGSASPTPSTFTVAGTNLTEAILVTSPAGFEISTSAPGGYGATATIGASGTVNATTLSLRLAATNAAGIYSGNITATSAGATSRSLATVSSTVGAKALTISGLIAEEKIYDSTTAATVGGTAALQGVLEGDAAEVVLGGIPLFAFESEDAGTNKPVTASGYLLGGTKASNYSLAQPTGLNATITAATATVIAADQTKAFGESDPALTYSGALLGGDIFSGSLGREAGEAVGTYSISLGTLSAGGNYEIVFAGANLTITSAQPAISTIPTASKIVHGQTLSNSTLTGGIASVNGTFAFTNPSTAPEPGVSSQSVTFTPQNSATHSPVILSVDVGVVPLPPTLARSTSPGATGFTVNVALQATGADSVDLRHSANKDMSEAVEVTGISGNATLTVPGPGMIFVQARSVNDAGEGPWSAVRVNQLLVVPAGRTRYLSPSLDPDGNHTVGGIFGLMNEAGLAASGTPDNATTILLLDASGSTTHVIFYNSSAGAWRDGPQNRTSLAIPRGIGFMLNNTGSVDDYIVLSGSLREGGSHAGVDVTPDAERFMLLSPGRTTPTRLVDLNLDPGAGEGQFKASPLARNADRLFIVAPNGDLLRYHHNGTEWRIGNTPSNDVTVPAGEGFFIKKVEGSTFESWQLPTD